MALLVAGAMLATWWAVHRRDEPESLGALVERVVAGGTADPKSRLPMGEGVRFRVGSVTKTFVAALVLRLVAEGKLHLDDSVARWAPELVPRGRTITVRQLLSHTSGLPDYVDDPRVTSHPGRRWRPAELVSIATSRDAADAAGKRFSYASTNYVVLGVVAGRVGGAPIGRLLRTRLFDPLGLRHTSYEPGPIPGDNVVGHRPPSHGGVVTGPPVDVEESAWWAGPAGAIVSTAGDVERFLGALLGGRVVPRGLLREMETAVPAGRNRYGLGIAVFPTPCGPAWGHTGNVQGTITVAWATRDATRRVVLVVNAYPLSPDLETAVRRVQVAAFCGDA